MSIDFRTPSARVGREVGPSGTPSYCRIVDARGIALSAHVAYDSPDELWLASRNERDDYRPARLTVEQARALRDGLDLFLADREKGAVP